MSLFKKHLAALGFFILLAAPASAFMAIPPGDSYVPGEILVRMRSGALEKDRSRALSPIGSSTPFRVRRNHFRVNIANGSSVENAIRQIRKDPAVEWAQPNYIYHAHLDCTPPGEFAHTYSPAIPSYAWPFIQIKAINADLSTPVTSAWGYLQSQCGSINAPITVAIIDTGVDMDNPDLPASIFVTGFNSLTGTSNAQDDYGHGTMVAGIVAGAWNNFSPAASESCHPGSYGGAMAGVAGMPGLVKIMPIKVLDINGSGTSQNIIDGTEYAIAHGAKLLNFSLGGSANDPIENTAITDALDAGCVVVASAGNSSSVTNIAALSYPAAYSGVIAVGATDSAGNMTYYSSAALGAGSFNLMAPGGGNACGAVTGSSACYDPAHDYFSSLLCPNPNSGFFPAPNDPNYGTDSGTSFSAPTVTGAAALLLALHPDWSAAEIAEQFKLTSTAMSGYAHTKRNGAGVYGRLNLAAALQTPFNTFTPTPSTTVIPTRTFTSVPSATRTRTPTRTPTNSRTPTSTATTSPTTTPTNSPTDSPTAAPSDSPTVTATGTVPPTLTATDSPTVTPTLTLPNTATVSPTPSPSNTAVVSPTFTQTPVPTPSFFTLSLPYPNPSRGSLIHWNLETPMPLGVEISIFTAKDREIRKISMGIGGNASITWDLKDDAGNKVANNIYFVRFKMIYGGHSAEKIFKVLVLE